MLVINAIQPTTNMLQSESTMLVTNVLTPAMVNKTSSEFLTKNEQQHPASTCVKSEDTEYTYTTHDLDAAQETASSSVMVETRPTGDFEHATKTSPAGILTRILARILTRILTSLRDQSTRAAPTSRTMSTTGMVVPRHAGTSHTPTAGRKDTIQGGIEPSPQPVDIIPIP